MFYPCVANYLHVLKNWLYTEFDSFYKIIFEGPYFFNL